MATGWRTNWLEVRCGDRKNRKGSRMIIYQITPIVQVLTRMVVVELVRNIWNLFENASKQEDELMAA